MGIKKINRITSIIVFVTQIALVLLNYIYFKEGSSPSGYGYIAIPFLLLEVLFTLTACFTFIKKFEKSIFLLIFNMIGIIWNLFWLGGSIFT
jgi:hypothetical protein